MGLTNFTACEESLRSVSWDFRSPKSALSSKSRSLLISSGACCGCGDPKLPIPTKLADDAVQRRVIPAITVARCSAVAAGFGPQIGPVLSPLFPQLFSVLATAGVGTIAPPLSLYEDHEDGAIKVSAAAQIDPSAAGQIGADTGLEVVMLPEIDAVTTTYVGAMATIGEAYEALFAWIAEHGLKTLGYSREAAIHCPSDPNEWITELQVPVVSLS